MKSVRSFLSSNSQKMCFFRGCLRKLVQPPVISVGFVDNKCMIVVSPPPDQQEDEAW